MDALENYKKAWSNQPENKDKLTSIEIYKLAHSKSSSIVKWIFIIGILEILFWTAVNFLVPDDFYKVYQDLELTSFLHVFMVLHYLIIAFFLFLFYKNYKRISIIDNTKKLIKNILKTRKTVQYYVYYNLGTAFLVGIVVNTVMFSDKEKLNRIMNPDNTMAMDISQITTVAVVSQIIALGIILVLLWLFYKVIYGFLLRKLNRNYKELMSLETV